MWHRPFEWRIFCTKFTWSLARIIYFTIHLLECTCMFRLVFVFKGINRKTIWSWPHAKFILYRFLPNRMVVIIIMKWWLLKIAASLERLIIFLVVSYIGIRCNKWNVLRLISSRLAARLICLNFFKTRGRGRKAEVEVNTCADIFICFDVGG